MGISPQLGVCSSRHPSIDICTYKVTGLQVTGLRGYGLPFSGLFLYRFGMIRVLLASVARKVRESKIAHDILTPFVAGQNVIYRRGKLMRPLKALVNSLATNIAVCVLGYNCSR